MKEKTKDVAYNSKKRLKVLVEAYECSPLQAHAPGAAWQIVSRLSRRHDIWVISEETQYADEINKYVKNQPQLLKSLHFVFIPNKKFYKNQPRPVFPIKSTLAYRKWLYESYATAKDLHKKINFDLVHHLRANTFRETGFFWKLPIPFIWGPTGGRTGVPWKLIKTLDLNDRLIHVLRNIINAIQFKYHPYVRNAVKNAKHIIAQTSYDQKKFKQIYNVSPTLMHEQATDPCASYNPRTYNGKRPLRILWVGKFISRKGLPILLRALSDKTLRGLFSLNIIGDGPKNKKWNKLATNLEINDYCRWEGWLLHQDVIYQMNQSDVLVISSLLEGTPAIVMEAFSTGLPVICMKHCGFGDVVDDTCGITFPVKGPVVTIANFYKAIHKLIAEPDLIKKLSSGAYEKARLYSWDNLANEIDITYRKAIV